MHWSQICVESWINLSWIVWQSSKHRHTLLRYLVYSEIVICIMFVGSEPLQRFWGYSIEELHSLKSLVKKRLCQVSGCHSHRSWPIVWHHHYRSRMSGSRGGRTELWHLFTVTLTQQQSAGLTHPQQDPNWQHQRLCPVRRGAKVAVCLIPLNDRFCSASTQAEGLVCNMFALVVDVDSSSNLLCIGFGEVYTSATPASVTQDKPYIWQTHWLVFILKVFSVAILNMKIYIWNYENVWCQTGSY